MENEIKRRIFLSGIVGTLIGAPIAVRLLRQKGGTTEVRHFENELKVYRSQIDVPVISQDSNTSSFSLSLIPPIGDEWKYTFFSPTFLPGEISLATGNDPDLFFVREGVLYFDKMNNGQTVITGGDSKCHVIAPTGKEEKKAKSVTILVNDGKLHLAKPKGIPTSENADVQLPHLLALDLPHQELKVGTKWKGNTGRLKPFTGYSTQYEILGFADVGGRQTVNIAFSGNIPNIAMMPGINEIKPEKNAVFTNLHHGNCYFDLKNGFLVRQEVEMDSFNSGIKGYKGKDGSDSVTIKTKFIIQVHTA